MTRVLALLLKPFCCSHRVSYHIQRCVLLLVQTSIAVSVRNGRGAQRTRMRVLEFAPELHLLCAACQIVVTR